MQSRLPAALEVAAIQRRAEAKGDFATVLRKGDADRGALLLIIACKGEYRLSLERVLSLDGGYVWQTAGPPKLSSSVEIRDFLEKREGFDEDFWAIELDVADPERFIAETTATG